MAEQLCPVCGCHIGAGAYEKEGVLYCCKPCATGGQCGCGCCEAVKEKKPNDQIQWRGLVHTITDNPLICLDS